MRHDGKINVGTGKAGKKGISAGHQDPSDPHGTTGTVRSVDGGANVWVNWDNGRGGIAVIYGVDEFVKIEEEKE